MDWWGRARDAKKWLAAVPFASIFSGDKLWIVAVAFLLLGVVLVLAVCWLASRDNTDQVDSPILRWRGKSSSGGSKDKGEGAGKDDAA
jgi:hypothetical protein